MADPPPLPAPSLWRYARAIIPALLFWSALVGAVAYLLYDRSRFSEKYDRAALREWIEERRPNRKSLGELVDDYLQEPTETRMAEIYDQLDAMMEPLEMFRGGTPLFLDVHSLRISFPERGDLAPLAWRSMARPPRSEPGGQIHTDTIINHRGRDGTRVVIDCDYRMHVFHKVQREEAQRQQWERAVGGVVAGASLAAIVWVYLFLRRERRRELAEVEANQALEHAENLRLGEQLRAQAAERAREELVRHLLEQKLEAARQEGRAAEAEKNALEMKSQLYASIGIMAGSYAHNIKNLLVRPNDLLSRCLEADGMAAGQTAMLHEVRSTLGTVTERLQQILRTVRRDPGRPELTPMDLGDLLRETRQTWEQLAQDKWKIVLSLNLPEGLLPVRGDLSHLQQAIENLVFNARDATFEMRNHLRENARGLADPASRRQALIDAAAWRGQVTLTGRREGGLVILEVRDNGIGMSDEVRQKCTTTHFSTKRDNALYEGYSAGMGLGLSFVVMVLEHHGARMEIESAPERGATFRIRFPGVE